MQLPHTAGSFARVAGAIGDAGAILGAIDLVRVEGDAVVRDVTVACADSEHAEAVVARGRARSRASTVDSVSDRTFLMHRGGKIEVAPKLPLKTRDDLSMAYTPGVARVCMAIHDDPASAWALTIKGNTVAVVTDGTAVLGLGDIGPAAAMPVMEGKAMLFKEFAGVDAFPLCLDTTDADEIVAFVQGRRADVRRHQPRGHRGAALLRDRAPAARRARHPGLPRRPARHRDRRARGAAQRAARRRQARRRTSRVVVVGAGAAGVACAEIMLAQGVGDVDRLRPPTAPLHVGRDRPRPRAQADARRAHQPARPARQRQRGARGRRRAHRRLGPRRGVAATRCARWRPTRSSSRWPTRRRRCSPRRSASDVAIMATGRSDYPNQINNVLAFPGVFRGALDVRATHDQRGDEARRRAARSRRVIPDDELHADYIIPSVFNREVAEAVAAAVAEAGTRSGVARRPVGTPAGLAGT